jgi:hypothetical protein
LRLRRKLYRLKLGLALLELGLSVPSAAEAQARIFSGGYWVALDRGAVCDAGTRGEIIATKGKVQAIAGFTFAADRSRWGEFYTRLSRPVRPGSTVVLQVGSHPFLLVAGGHWAWSRSASQQESIIAAVRANQRMKVEARDPLGRRIRDYYLLAGAPTAIDAAAARCAGKTR